MKELGLGLLLVGLVSLIIPYLGMKFIFLGWIDQWGPTVSLALRVGATVLGLLLYLTGRRRD